MFMQDITRFAATPVADARTGLDCGLFGPTLVETETGWRPAATLRIGDRVQTLDGGLQRIAALSRRSVAPGEAAIQISGGHFDACDDVWLLPGQGVLLDSAGLVAAPYARVAAATLATCLGASQRPTPARFDIVTPLFAEEEAVWAQSGMLLLCPGLRGGDSAFPQMHDRAARLFLTERTRRFA